MSGLQQPEQRLLFVTFLLVFVLGAGAVYSFTRGPLKADTTLDQVSKTSENRGPASVKLEQESERASNFNKSISLSLDCGSESSPSVGTASHLRLHGLSCAEKGEIVAIKNISNGFTAQVIPLNVGGFTTDFIDLQSGVNEIQVSRQGPEGKIEQQLVKVLRAPASEPAP